MLAGIFIHDIGMQCDVVLFPEIWQRACELGADFESKEFKSQSTNSYSLDEQAAIRKNHHWLSIAWIDVARTDFNNLLHKAASAIPGDLFQDLMDVAVHHTKLPIGECPKTLQLDSNDRKQFVAALLRFSDELDIQDDRIDIETVKMARLAPANSVYWWLHYLTRITIPQPGLVKVVVTLHPDDFKEFASVVESVYLNRFRTKNSPVLTALAQNQTNIVIAHDSNAIEFRTAERLPADIKAELRRMASPMQNADPLADLSNEMALWLRAIRYEVGLATRVDEHVDDMRATLDTGTIKQNVLVRCIGRAITVPDVEKLESELTRKVNQGLLVSDRPVSSDVRKSLKGTDVQAFRLSEFLQQQVWGPYIDSLQSFVERHRIPELYVDIGCYRQPFCDSNNEESKREDYESLDTAIDEWLVARDKMHVSLLGEFGSGKTWFCWHYAYRQLEKYLKNPAGERLPLLITLRNFTKAQTAKELITNAVVDQYKLSFVGDPFEIFEELNRRGKILLILDGFDEMARKVDKQRMVDNFWELAKLVRNNSKVILTSRTEYFRWAKEAESVFGGEEFGRQISELKPPKFDVLYLRPFTAKQIRSAISRRLGANSKQTADELLRQENIRELASKPVLVELLLAAVESGSVKTLKTQAEVYLFATNELLLRNIKEERTFTSTADKLLFLGELAWEMINTGELRIHFRNIPDRIREHFAEKIQESHEIDHWDYDLRSQTLLRSDLHGYYEFSHKSLAEFFIAFKFAGELGWLSAPFDSTYEESRGKSCELPFHPVANDDLRATFGAKNIASQEMQAVRAFMQQMVSAVDTNTLLSTLDSLRGNASLERVTPNIMTLLSDAGVLAKAEHLRDLDFAGSVVGHTQLQQKDVSNSKFWSATIVLEESGRLENDGLLGCGTVAGAPVVTTGSEAHGILVSRLAWQKMEDEFLAKAPDDTRILLASLRSNFRKIQSPATDRRTALCLVANAIEDLVKKTFEETPKWNGASAALVTTVLEILRGPIGLHEFTTT